MNIKSLIASTAVILGLSAGVAHADTFVFHDTAHNFKFSYPDTWRLNAVSDNMRVRITPLQGDDNAECYMSAVKDQRLTIYPEKYLKITNPIVLGDTFWAQDILPNYENVSVHKYHPAAGLGQGYATSIQITWGGDVVKTVSIGLIEEETIDYAPVPLTTDLVEDVEVVDIDVTGTDETTETAKTPMRANMIASIYGDYRYRFTCQSNLDAFEKWRPIFASITASVLYDSRYTAYPTGFYRDFLSDKPLLKKPI